MQVYTPLDVEHSNLVQTAFGLMALIHSGQVKIQQLFFFFSRKNIEQIVNLPKDNKLLILELVIKIGQNYHDLKNCKYF